MRVLVALDKFKEALSAPAACAVLASGLRSAHPGWTLDLCPLADGGDGFVTALTAGERGEIHHTPVHGPRGDPLDAPWALVPTHTIPASVLARMGLNRDTCAPLAVLEMAACSGLAIVPPARRDVWQSSSSGVGELILAAVRAGAGSILLGVGGSATNDLGLGALSALGFRALDASGRDIDPLVPRRFRDIARILPAAARSAAAAPRLPIYIACDVDNPLCGPRGATFTYGPQKGLAANELSALDTELARVGAMLATACGADPKSLEQPGSGAAGGIAAGLMIACGARLVGGFDLVADWLELERRVAAADLVITGEGRFDDTSLNGKGPGGLARAALAQGKRAVVVAGSIQLSQPCLGLELFSITPPGMPLAEALPETARLLGEAARRIG